MRRSACCSPFSADYGAHAVDVSGSTSRHGRTEVAFACGESWKTHSAWSRHELLPQEDARRRSQAAVT